MNSNLPDNALLDPCEYGWKMDGDQNRYLLDWFEGDECPSSLEIASDDALEEECPSDEDGKEFYKLSYLVS